LDIGQPSLKHQRYDEFDVNNERHTHDRMGAWYARGQSAGPAATKFRPGACTNCGAMTHQAKFCTERKRKLGAKFSGEDIRADEVIKDVRLDYAGQRDRWNGYDADEYKRVIELYEKTDRERMRLKAEEQAKKFLETQTAEGEAAAAAEKKAEEAAANAAAGIIEEEQEDDFLESGDAEGRAFQKKDSKSTATVRNLRIREDTAKYLYNLNPDSAYYDAKTRSMRGNPHPEKDDATFKGDNFVKMTGEAEEFYRLQKFAWEAEQRGETHHAQAVPSMTLQAYKEAVKQTESQVDEKKKDILAEYGGAEHLDAAPPELILAQTEQFVEYTPDGRIIQPVVPGDSMPRSKYDEDVFWSNHTAVWGSFWHEGKWGYACCHQMVKNSYCTGPPKRVPKAPVASAAPETSDPSLTVGQTTAAESSSRLSTSSEAVKSTKRSAESGDDSGSGSSSDSDSDSRDKRRKHKKRKHKKEKKHKKDKKHKSSSRKRKRSDDDSDDDQRRKRRSDKRDDKVLDERKRKYNAASGGYDNVQVTEKDIEHYQRDRDIWDDPMKNAN
jgi:pre-mRNA-processing factor SLU7